MNIKKSDLLIRISQELNSALDSKGFRWDKGNKYFVKEFDRGKYLLGYNVLNSYNFDKDDVAWDIKINYFVYHEEVHGWFLKFEHRSTKDQKFDWTYGTSSEKNEYFVDVFEPNINSLLDEYVSRIVTSLYSFMVNNDGIESLMDKTIKNANNVTNITKGVNFRQLITDLTILKMLDVELFQKHVSSYTSRAEKLFTSNDPMAKIYYPKWEEILSELEKLEKHCKAD